MALVRLAQTMLRVDGSMPHHGSRRGSVRGARLNWRQVSFVCFRVVKYGIKLSYYMVGKVSFHKTRPAVYVANCVLQCHNVSCQCLSAAAAVPVCPQSAIRIKRLSRQTRAWVAEWCRMGYKNIFFSSTPTSRVLSLSDAALHWTRLQESTLSAGSFCDFPLWTHRENTG